MTIAAVRRFYFKHHVNAVRNGRDVVRDKVGPKRAFGLLLVYMTRYLEQNGIEGAPMVGQFSLAQQTGFMRYCRDKHKHGCKTISTYLSYIKAGFRFAATPLLITDSRGVEREARLLDVAPFVNDNEAKITEITGLARSKPRDWIPSDAQLAAIIDQLASDNPAIAAQREPSFRYVVMALNTMARPEAIIDLSVLKQANFENRTINLNPPGRIQNKKVRPHIPMTDCLAGWLLHWDLDHPIVYLDRVSKGPSIKTLQAAAKRAEIADWEKFNRYTLRHYMATRVRRVPGFPVTREERAAWMGHTDPEHRTTEHHYESLDFDYLAGVRDAVDALMRHLNALLKRRQLLPPNVRQGTRLTLVRNPQIEATSKLGGAK